MKLEKKINCTNINTTLNNKIAQILRYNFMDLIRPKKHEIKIKNVIFRFIEIKTYTYPIHEIILKNYQTNFKNFEIKQRQNRTLYKPYSGLKHEKTQKELFLD